MFKSYEAISEFLGNKTNRPYPSIRSTRIVRYGDNIAIRYHDTNVITYTPNSIIFTSGGWHTVTTKSRINDVFDHVFRGMSIRLYQDRGIWYVTLRDRSHVVFYDGIEFNYGGNLLNPPNENAENETKVKTEHIRKQIKQYCDTLETMLRDRTLEKPSSGDCWYCAMSVVSSGENMGDSFNDHSHLISHLEESYVVPSLVKNALEEYSSQMDRAYMMHVWDKRTDPFIASMDDMLIKDIRKSVKRYLERRLI